MQIVVLIFFSHTDLALSLFLFSSTCNRIWSSVTGRFLSKCILVVVVTSSLSTNISVAFIHFFLFHCRFSSECWHFDTSNNFSCNDYSHFRRWVMIISNNWLIALGELHLRLWGTVKEMSTIFWTICEEKRSKLPHSLATFEGFDLLVSAGFFIYLQAFPFWLTWRLSSAQQATPPFPRPVSSCLIIITALLLALTL